MNSDETLASFLRKLTRRTSLDPTDQRAVLGLPHRLRQLDRGAFLVREGDAAFRCNILVSGFAFSPKTCASGARAVLAIHMDGDPLDISACSHSEAACDVQALTPVTVADISRNELCELAHSRPQIGEALWHLTARNASVLGEWLTNVGRRNVRGRISHLICEIATRQEANGISTGENYLMPLTQEQLGDSTGLTSVHVNRILQGLRRDDLIANDKGRVRIVDWDGLKSAGDFRPGYLQLAVESDCEHRPGMLMRA